MRWSALLVTFLFVFVTVPVQSQEDAVDYVVMGTDPEGDIHGIAGDMGVVVRDNAWGPLDLLRFEMQEDEASGFLLRLAVGSLDVTLPNAPDVEETADAVADDLSRSIDYYFEFKVRDVQYLLRTVYDDESRTAISFLQRIGSDRFPETLGEVPVRINEDLPGFDWVLPSGLVADSDGVAPRIGDSFVDMRWRSYSTGAALVTLATYGAAQAFMDYQDRMPDGFSAYLESTWEVQAGVASQGTIAAWSDLPVRVSNGEATTYLFEVEVQNLADFVDTVIPEVEGAPENWILTFPTGKVRLSPEETKVIPFLVTVPFAHEHGNYDPFTVRMQSQADPQSAGLVELGVRYTKIPQPAGHHPSLYLHGQGSLRYFNTVEGEDYPEDSEEAGSNSGNSCGGGDVNVRRFPLSPSLQLGLDFDMDAVGEAELMFASEQPSEGYSFSAYFVVGTTAPSPCDAVGRVPEGAVAHVQQTEPISLPNGGTATATAEILPLPAGDYIPYHPANQMWMLWMEHAPSDSGTPFNPGSFLDVGLPQVQPDSSFFMPLVEYHDDVDEYFDLLTGIDLYPTTEQERYVNPGETVIFRLTAQNIGAATTTFELDLSGTHLDWVDLLGSTTIKLQPGASHDMALAVRVPAGTSDGELVDVTLHATHVDDDSVRSLIRFLAEADDDADHPDEADQTAILDAELQQAPTPFLPGLLLLLLVAYRRRRSG